MFLGLSFLNPSWGRFFKQDDVRSNVPTCSSTAHESDEDFLPQPHTIPISYHGSILELPSPCIPPLNLTLSFSHSCSTSISTTPPPPINLPMYESETAPSWQNDSIAPEPDELPPPSVAQPYTYWTPPPRTYFEPAPSFSSLEFTPLATSLPPRPPSRHVRPPPCSSELQALPLLQTTVPDPPPPYAPHAPHPSRQAPNAPILQRIRAFRAAHREGNVRDVPQALRTIRQQTRVRRARTKLAWLEKHEFLGAQERLLRGELDGT